MSDKSRYFCFSVSQRVATVILLLFQLPFSHLAAQRIESCERREITQSKQREREDSTTRNTSYGQDQKLVVCMYFISVRSIKRVLICTIVDSLI